jgi:positive regulator of sigma E activity
MKPTVPETGVVIKLEGQDAVVMMTGHGSCKGCGQAALGLCNAGKPLMVRAKNIAGANIGESVKIGIDRNVQIKGYALSFGIPLFSLIGGSTAGYAASFYFAMPAIDVLAGFISFAAASALSFKRLNKLDAEEHLIIKTIVRDPIFTDCC